MHSIISDYKAKIQKKSKIFISLTIIDTINVRRCNVSTSDANFFQKEGELERCEQSLANIDETQHRYVNQLEEEKTNIQAMEQEVIESKKLLETYVEKLQEVNEQISDAHGFSNESESAKRRNEAVENLKRLFHEKVYGRIVDLCSPSNNKYKLALTKVLGSNMNAIVVDNDDTAEECIGYLKEQRFYAEKFLPLSAFQHLKPDERLRHIREPEHVDLLFDVIKRPIQAVEPAILYACNNAVVCDKSENAKKMAYDREYRCKAVSLDGTLFQQGGIISGGAADLRRQATKWDEKETK